MGGEVFGALARAVELQDHAVVVERGRDRSDEAARAQLADHHEAARAVMERAQRDRLVARVGEHDDRHPRRHEPRARDRRELRQIGRRDAQQQHVGARRVGVHEEIRELRRGGQREAHRRGAPEQIAHAREIRVRRAHEQHANGVPRRLRTLGRADHADTSPPAPGARRRLEHRSGGGGA